MLLLHLNTNCLSSPWAEAVGEAYPQLPKPPWQQAAAAPTLGQPHAAVGTGGHFPPQIPPADTEAVLCSVRSDI